MDDHFPHTRGYKMNQPNKNLKDDGNQTKIVVSAPLKSARVERGRFKRPNTPTNISVVESDGMESDVSYRSIASLASSESRMPKRGRPPASMKYLPTSKRKATTTRHPSEERITTDVDTEGENLSVASSSLESQKFTNQEDIIQIVQSQPVDELGDCIKRQLETIERVSGKSRSQNAQEVKFAMQWLKATTGELTRRLATDASVVRLESEIMDLRSQLSTLTAEITKLRGQNPGSTANLQLTQNTAANVSVRVPSSPNKLTNGMEERLMEQVKILVENQFSAFKAEIFPDRYIRPSLGENSSAENGQLSSKTKGKKNKLKKARIAHLPVEELPPVGRPEPQASTSTNTIWEVFNTKKTAKAKIQKNQPAEKISAPSVSKVQKQKKKVKIPKASETAAVTITVMEGSSMTYSKITEEVKAKIRLSDLGIDNVFHKRSLTGGILMTIGGPECAAKAEKLAAQMREVLSDNNIRISRPVKTGDIRLRDLDDAATPQEVAAAVAEAGGCSTDDIKVGEIRRTPTAMGTCWVRCPLTALQRIVSDKRIRVGWGYVRVEVLEARPLHCFRCLEKGHVGIKCPNKIKNNRYNPVNTMAIVISEISGSNIS
ncbi:hypothetical protein O3G_MSEX012603 [Manduca sexta]|uniref:CCHC-type domain-containing protein n=1 Tax=Manduca sexta TaxID=7130 RepID=A0A921ZPG9_MANSE|nr:hypothetical protein O3G_MSEX012603 [Manduca sexta]